MGNPPIQELVELARAAYQRRDFLNAARLYSDAAQQLQIQGEALQAAEMANNASVSWLQAGDAQQALSAVVGTDSVFAASGDIKKQAMAIGNQAAALEYLRRFDEALALYQRSAELLSQVGESELRAYVMQAISKVQFRKGKYFEALATMQSGVEGLQHPNLRQRFLRRLLQFPMRWLGGR